jgi:hypothetical protein
MIGGAVALVAVVAWLRLGGPRGADPGASAPIGTADASRSAPAAISAPVGTTDDAWRHDSPVGTARVVALQGEPFSLGSIDKIDGARRITATGDGETDDAALAAARVQAVVALAQAVRAALPPEVAAADDAAAPAPSADEIARRFLAHLGVGATPERTSARTVAASGGHTIEAQFRVGDAAFAQAVAYFGTPRSFRGADVAPALPAVAEAGWVVVTAPAGSPLRARDRIVAIGGRAIAPSELPSAVPSADPELHLARGREIIIVRWSP